MTRINRTWERNGPDESESTHGAVETRASSKPIALGLLSVWRHRVGVSGVLYSQASHAAHTALDDDSVSISCRMRRTS